ncbi:MAG: hypothetical protein K6E85_16840 [Lachnospiraceae bacterium]|nr:hypothetical protein [Lachnospiraceae bacterium]
MKKRISALSRITALALCMALLLNITGCRSSKPDTTSETPTNVENPVNTGDPANTGNPSDTENNGGTANPPVTVDNSGASSTSDNTGNTSPSQDAADPDNSPTSAPQPKIDDNGKPIADFDEYVNGEWRHEQEAKESSYYYINYEAHDMVKERLRDILENTDISTLSEEDGLYKAIVIYRELTKTDDLQERVAYIKDYLSAINKVKTLEDLYELYGNENYSLFNMAFRFEVKSDSNGNNLSYYRPISITESIRRAQAYSDSDETEEELIEGKKQLYSYFSELGFTSDRADEMLQNAKIVSDILDEFPQVQPDGSYTNYYFTEEDLDKVGVSIPVFDILRKLNGLGTSEAILASENVCELLKKLFTNENIVPLRDYMLVYAIMTSYSVSGYITEFKEDYDYGEYVLSILMDLAADVLANEYMNRYLPEDTLETLRVLTADIKEAAKAVIYEADWLSASSKESARAKLMKMRVCAGKNGYENDLSDVVISGNTMEDFIGLYVSNGRFLRSQASISGDFRKIFGAYLFDVNGRYFGDYNSYVLTAGLLCNEICTEKSAFEERLGYLGFLIAHEISHSYDPQCIDQDEYGYYNPWMKEEEVPRYKEIVQKIYAELDGIDAGYGKQISGARTLAETYTDLMAMQICLKMLSEMENPDYDLFFTTLAKQRAVYYSEKGVDAVLADEHLPGNIRNNFTFSQFDKFYEIYDIDESSPYYVPEEKRLKAF